jgi:micrococcal nuclease
MITISIFLFGLISNLLCSNSITDFEYNRTIDGDTFTININNIPEAIGKDFKVRIYGINTPETRTKDLCEKQRGLEAKLVTENLLKSAKSIVLKDIKKGKYEYMAKVIVDGEDLSQVLLNYKLAYPYYGEKKRKINWCSNDNQEGT